REGLLPARRRRGVAHRPGAGHVRSRRGQRSRGGGHGHPSARARRRRGKAGGRAGKLQRSGGGAVTHHLLLAAGSGTNLDPIYAKVLFWILAVLAVSAALAM